MPLRARLNDLHPNGQGAATTHRLYGLPAVPIRASARNPSMRFAVPAALSVCLALAACAHVRQADVRLPGAFEAPPGQAPAGAVPLDRWWLAFNDAELTGLIDQALA